MSSRFAALLGTAVVVVRGIPLVLHSAAHMQLGIYLPSVLANAYIAVVLFIAPVAAAILLWSRYARAGAWLLFWSMFGSLVFGFYNHFVAISPDHVTSIPATSWGHLFAMTAFASFVLEAAGCVAAIYLLCGPLRRSKVKSAISAGAP